MVRVLGAKKSKNGSFETRLDERMPRTKTKKHNEGLLGMNKNIRSKKGRESSRSKTGEFFEQGGRYVFLTCVITKKKKTKKKGAHH